MLLHPGKVQQCILMSLSGWDTAASAAELKHQMLRWLHCCWVQDALDTVKGYFGMRKAHIAPLPNNGPMVIWLNNKPITQVGLLDQVSSLPRYLMNSG